MRDFSKEQILTVLDVADAVKCAVHDRAYRFDFQKKYGKKLERLLHDTRTAIMFVENSTRTHYSFRAAVTRAGGNVDGFSSADDTSLKKGETWADTAAMFAGYGCDALVMRTTIEGIPRWTKEFLQQNNAHLQEQHQRLGLSYSYRTPLVINGGDGKNQHPSQCFLDVFTIRELARGQGKELDGLEIALLNDLKHGRTNASLMSVAHHFDWTLHLAHPHRFGPPLHRLEELTRRGVTVHNHHEDFLGAMDASFVAYHSRPQKERVGAGEDLLTIKELGRITRERYDQLGSDAPYLMHPLPVDSETFEEIYHDLNFHPKNVTDMQASNGLYVRIALLALGLEKLNVEYPRESSISGRETIVQPLPIDGERKKISNPRSGYIEGNGLVLDHIPVWMGRRLAGILGLEKEQIPKVISDHIDGERGPKDMIKLHGRYEPTTQQYEAMALLAPDITVSFVEDSRVVRKVRPVVGSIVEDLVRCGNEACATNVRKEHITPKHHVEDLLGGRILSCHYCDLAETLPRVYEDNRFLYLGEKRKE